MTGEGGTDALTGGGGRDVFAFRAAADSTSTARDVILDFVRGTDRVDLSAIDARSGAAGDQAFAFIGGGAFTGQGGQLRATRAASDTFIEADVNGDEIADFALGLDDPLTLSAADFLL